ncbi:N-acetylglucosamine-6-phosphate deacetylase [Brevibacillus porteri]|uniref:N-acetylglucosamine-6-phosphate deacetylase n=1 Tax=Brevibacillus porteri TaxID=2126350 RepID=A0ABX5FT47_9BACL|nr:N-acetylglucosamine-6-phosphate deacetylase [Brevibacillus porteri]MED1798029.1 N-acetylglucosamine-6-phosphate deacetylase [Brevibacillus porteri]MED2132136.1 N-acetylglucosamine-6-phosphate deacetylase [Brevibacillus porteri]MED2742699.1 N-acetylglucosamine-6-phosphate deacetylase [Brevibacillus porteri]MED2814175.1 N-acetylglucosamine-6-phosphate deacetylase [Brevibacillus porteri]MED2893736.1 N-acetylglucosamine-6-phosphate deacetylase [Brevibacillus porteri]
MNQEYALKGNLVADGQELHNGLVVVGNGKITYVGKADEYGKALPNHVVTVEDGWICPGFVDMHMHGIDGYDTMDGTPESLQAISTALARHGVTSFLATTMTAPYDQLEQVLVNIALNSREGLPGAEAIGIHLEGPWINPRYKGAQKEENIAIPKLDVVQKLYGLSEGLIKVVTIAPEQPEALEAIAWLKERDVIVSAGHTGATFAQATEAVDAGVRHFTHCFNAMTGLHHREPGVVGAAMYHEQLSTELIADGIHVHPAVMKILYRVKTAERLALVSDSMRAAAMGEGTYDLGGQEVHVHDNQAKLADGTLAGSILTLNRAVGNMVTLSGVSLPDAVEMASLTPASILGFGERKGRLAAGYDADITVLNAQFDVTMTFVGGKEVYRQLK